MNWQLLIFLTFILHGFRTFFNKKLSHALSPISANFWAFLVSLPLAFTAKYIFHPTVAFKSTDFAFLFIGAFMGVALVALFYALKLNVHKTSVATTFNIVITMLLGALFLGEWQLLNPFSYEGSVTLTGIMLLMSALYFFKYRPVTQDHHKEQTDRWLLFVLINVVLSGISGFFAKYFIAKVHPFEALPIQMLGSFLILGLICLITKKIELPTSQAWMYILGRSILLIAIVFVTNLALQSGPVVLISPLKEAGWTVIDIIVGLFIFHERKALTRYSLIGISLGVIGGLLLTF